MTKAFRWAIALPLPLIAATVAILVSFISTPVTSLQDDWYSFVTFQDPREWKRVYGFTCQYKPDHFREPREYQRRDDLVGPRELKSPIAFRSKDTETSKEHYTLHIYNSPPIRKGYSVSYGFQRNKECLHGQDAECIVYPNLGRIRAVVVNAERFQDKQNLNFIKDHFLIEEPERFATILNGGSIFERKFYEAVFLGGYTRDPERTSHQIDGKKYPMEIYMYFLDETVPSVSLSTILVVLVEESDRENANVKPVVNAIENKLYNAERRFLEENRGLIRRERLFHHLEGSTTYDIHDRLGRWPRGESIYQETLEHAATHEGKYTRFVETFEKMESLETELFFLYEDLRRVNELIEIENQIEQEFGNRVAYGEHIPNDVTEIHIATFVALIAGWQELFGRGGCLQATQQSTYPFPDLQTAWEYSVYWQLFLNGSGYSYNYFPTIDALIQPNPSVPGSEKHFKDFEGLTYYICEAFRLHKQLYDINQNDTIMKGLTVQQKYNLIYEFANNRKLIDVLNDFLHQHFHNSPFHTPGPPGTPPSTVGAKRGEFPKYKYPEQKFHIVDGMFEYIFGYQQRLAFTVNRDEIIKKINDTATKLQYKDDKTMKQVIRYIKYGDRAEFLLYPRNKVHKNSQNKISPEQEKKRSLVEYGGMEMTEEQIESDSGRNPIKQIVDESFQITWLIPQDGGYYYYKGSSPLPPCFRAQNVIVFKKPIKMTRRQINILAKVPTSFDRKEDIRVTTPFVHDTYFDVDLTNEETENTRTEEVKVPVYNEKRNHLFLGRDGVHKNAVEEWNRLLEMRKNGAPAINGKKLTQQMIIIFVVIIKIVFA